MDRIIVPTELVINYHKMFGPILGFVLLELKCTHLHTGKPLPGIVFLRGDSVACLILIEEEETGKLFFLVVKQTRVPMGKEVYEICAGMVDRDVTRIVGAMAKEVQEETGIEILVSELVRLGTFRPSQGGTQESIELFLLKKTMTSSQIAEIKGRVISNEHEFIKVEVLPFTMENVAAVEDSKTSAAVIALLAKSPEYFARMMAQE
jgi:ADP-sugar diphosphatase